VVISSKGTCQLIVHHLLGCIQSNWTTLTMFRFFFMYVAWARSLLYLGQQVFWYGKHSFSNFESTARGLQYPGAKNVM